MQNLFCSICFPLIEGLTYKWGIIFSGGRRYKIIHIAEFSVLCLLLHSINFILFYSRGFYLRWRLAHRPPDHCCDLAEKEPTSWGWKKGWSELLSLSAHPRASRRNCWQITRCRPAILHPFLHINPWWAFHILLETLNTFLKWGCSKCVFYSSISTTISFIKLISAYM